MRDPFTRRRTRRKSDSNPYVERSFQHPGRIFVFEDAVADIAAVRNLLVGQDIYCDLGSGSGAHLLGLGQQNPDASAFGFEIRYKRSVRTVEKAVRDGIDNVFVLRVDAGAIDQVFPARSIKGVFVNFPDPWAKQKKTKKRMMQAEFLDVLGNMLVPGGFVALKTDHKQYYDWFLSQAESCKTLSVTQAVEDLYSSALLGGNIATEFERLFVSKNMPIYYAKLMALER